jgi:Zn-dependent protease
VNARLGSNELIELLIAYVVLTAAFGVIISGGFSRLSADAFIITGIGVGTGFLLHELAHKFTAQRYGYMAEFKLSMNGLFLTIISAAIGFLFAAPGAVVIYGRAQNTGNTYEYGTGSMDDDEYWDRLSSSSKVNKPELYISIAGVITNLLIALVFLLVLRGHLVPWQGFDGFFYTQSILAQAAYYGLMINIVLAAFNMIPFGPLDGAKVLRANPVVWAIVGLPVIFFWLLLMFGPGYNLLSLLIGA